MKPRHWVLIIVLLALATIVPVSALNPGYQVNRWTASGSAGGVSTSAGYAVHGTLGQPAVETSSGDTYTVISGIWRGASRGFTVYLPLVLNNYDSSGEIAGDVSDDCPGYSISVGQQYIENFDKQYDKDWYEFSASSGTTYDIATYDLENTDKTDTILFLFTSGCPTSQVVGDVYCSPGGTVCKRISNGAIVFNCVCNDDCGGDAAAGSCFSWQASSSGSFDIFIRNYYWDTDYGNDTHYSLRVSQSGGALMQSSGTGEDNKPAPPAEE